MSGVRRISPARPAQGVRRRGNALRISVGFDEWTFTEIQRLAAEREETFGAVVRSLVSDSLDKEELTE